MMVELGLGAHDIDGLKKVDWATLNKVANAAAAKMLPREIRELPCGHGQGSRLDGDGGWQGAERAAHTPMPFRTISKNVPLMVGSVSEEGMRYISNPTEEQWKTTLTRQFGDAKATALIAAMKKSHPEKSVRLLSYGVMGITMRNSVQRMVKLKYDQKGAPVYAYHFQWQSPMLEDSGAWHTAELAFCFDNTKRCEQATGNTAEAQSVAKKMATAWSNFAKTGNPSQPGLTWTPADPVRCQTMLFDTECRMVDDPEGDVRKILL